MIIDTNLFCNNDFLPLQTPADLQAMGFADPGTPVLHSKLDLPYHTIHKKWDYFSRTTT